MIQTKIYYQDEVIKEIDINNHAESDDYKYDLVCAAVSAISIGLINALIEDAKVDLSSFEYEVDEAHTNLKIVTSNERIQTILETGVIMLSTVENSYIERENEDREDIIEYIKIIKVEV